MGVFGGFIYGGESVGGDVYGPDVDVVAAELIALDAVRINVEAPIVVDAAYNDPANYNISVVSGPGQGVSVRRVLPTNDDTTSEIILIMDKVSRGTTYEVSIGAALRSSLGQSVVGTAQFVGRRTKTENMIRSLPAHFNTHPESIVRSIVTAIGLADETIGGSQDDPLD